MFRAILRVVQRFAVKKMRTEVFDTLSNKELATPQLVKGIMVKPIPFHSRTSKVSLYHKKRVRHAIKSCFSQKKTKRFKRVHKLKRFFHSEILNRKLKITLTTKAFRCIKKMGSFDNYILCTKPKDLDSKLGQYLRTIMLRKINDPEYRLPYILGTNRVPRIRKYFRHLRDEEHNRVFIPKQFKKNYITYQKKFGTLVDEFNEEDYQKYLQLEKMKKLQGKDFDPNHPLLIELDKKLGKGISQEEEDRLREMSAVAKQNYLSHKNTKQLRKAKFERLEKEGALREAKIREAFIKYKANKQP